MGSMGSFPRFFGTKMVEIRMKSFAVIELMLIFFDVFESWK